MSIKMKAAKNINNFKALELKVSNESLSSHIIYFKEHMVREHSSDRPSGKTLFILNIPPYVDEQGLRNAFHGAGYVKAVQFCLKPGPTETKLDKFIEEGNKSTFKVAYLVFSKVVELERALNLTELLPLNNDNYKCKLGIKKWIDKYNTAVFTTRTLKENIESYMQKYDKEMKKKEKKEKKLEEEDDEGWVTVTKRGKVQSFARTEKVENKILQKEEKNKKRKELKNFYTFQIRESKMKHIVALRQKFEEDKRKIAQIKQTRRFKPF